MLRRMVSASVWLRLRAACVVVCFVSLGCGGESDEPAGGAPEAPGERIRVGEGDAAPNALCRPSSVAVGMLHTCEIDSLGHLSCGGTIEGVPVTPPAGMFRTVSSGDWQSCAIDDVNTLRCWGTLYTPNADPLFGPTIEAPPGTFRAVAAGGALICGIRMDDTLVCWGDDGAIAGIPTSGTFTAIAAGTMHGCAIRTDGTLVCWGFDSEGSTMPPEGTFRAISAGAYRTCAVRTDDGSLACWGAQPDLTEMPSPAGAFVTVSVGGHPGAYDWYACGIRDDGSAECWNNEVAPLFRSGPLAGTFALLSAGSYQFCAVDMDCRIACTPNPPP